MVVHYLNGENIQFLVISFCERMVRVKSKSWFMWISHYFGMKVIRFFVAVLFFCNHYVVFVKKVSQYS